MSLITFLIVGLVAGAIARALMPGRQSFGVIGTLLLGVGGSFVGGVLSSLLRSDGSWLAFSPSGLLWSTIGSIVVLALASVGRGARA